jgi:putative peptide zinc metalloprotease protein
MPALDSGADLRGRKKVCLRLRPNLECVPQGDRGQPVHVLKDPVSLSYYRLDERQHFLVSLMDGARTLDEIQKEYEKRFRPDRLPLEELEAFAAQLVNGGLALNDSPLAGRLLYEQAEKQRRQARRARLLSFVCIRIPLFNPDRLLTRIVPLAGALFTLPFFLLALALLLTAAGLVATHWGEFLARLPEYRELFSARWLLTFWVALGLVKVVHELGHGVCCKKFGGESHEMGVLLLFFFPSLYCDVSDSWKLPSRRRRMAISAAGIYVELLVAALATFAWWASDAGTVVHQLCFGLMVVCSAGTVLCNANPLMRLDGYYALSDALGIPNLAELAGHALRSAALRWLGVQAPPPLPVMRGRRAFLAAYAVAAYAYRCLVLAVSLYLLNQFLLPRRLAPLGLALAAAVAAVLVAVPLYGFVRAVQQQGGLWSMKLSRVGLSLGAVGAVLAFVFLVPLPLKVEAVALLAVEADHVERVAVPDGGGFLQEVLVRDGQRVREGEVLAVLANPRLQIALRVNEADQGLRQQQREEAAYPAEAAAREADGDLGRVEFELQSLLRQHAVLTRQAARLTLRAPRAGTVMGLPSREEVGKWLEGGTELCRVGKERALRAVLLVETADQPWVRPGGEARVRVHGCGGASWPGVVSDVAQVEARNIPPQLSQHAGGEVVTDQDPVSREEAPRGQYYLVSVRLAATDPRIHPGALGRVQIRAGSQTLAWRLRRYLAVTFDWGL